MKNTNKIISVILALLMVVSIVPMQLFAATVETPWETQTSANFKDNVFLDALAYLGYDITAFTKDGKYGSNVSSSDRTDIGYNSAGATGFETTSAGKPNVATFESKGLCCASYATYVYFNYLPNVYGLDMSDFAKPSNGRSTAAWATACEKWVSNGIAKKTLINKDSDEDLSALKNVPIGSLITFTDANGNYSHTGIYAGYKTANGKTTYFQTQVGGSRGPEVQVINGFYYVSGDQSVFQRVYAAYTPILPENPVGAVGVKKVDDAGNAVANVKIGVYTKSNATGKVAEITTDKNGNAVYGYSSGDYTLDVGNTYYFKEISAPEGYDLSTQIVSATVVKDKITYASVNIVDNRQGWLVVTKYDDADTKLGKGYVFGIYSDKDCTKEIAQITTDANGNATSDWLTAGTYYVKELAIPDGDTTHELNSSVYTVVVNKGEKTLVNNGKFVNDRLRGDAEVVKVSEDGIVEGMEFRLHGTSDSGEAVDMTAKTDANGRVEFKNVLIGTYTIEEINTPDRYVAPKSQTITVKADEISEVTFSNVLKRLALQVTKVDSETGKTILYAGAGFQIFDANNNLVVIDGVDTFYTDANGTITTNKALVYGKYTLVEVEAPYGYILDSTPIAFEVNTNTIETVNGVQLVKVVKSDLAQKGTITIAKQGEVFSTVVEENGSYLPVFALKNLSNAIYEITATEDIITPDGSVRAKKGDVVATLTTSSNGAVTSAPLYLGKYTVTETKAPEGYVLNTEPVTVELTYAGQDIDIAVQYVSFTNDRQKVEINLSKVLEQDELFEVGMNGEISDVQFALYAAEDLVAEDGTVIPADALIEIASCDENGKLTFTTDVPFGNYYVQEYATHEKYILSDTKYPIEFKYDGQDKSVISVAVNDGVDITNDIIRGTIVGQKIDEDGNSIEGAVFGLFRTDVILPDGTVDEIVYPCDDELFNDEYDLFDYYYTEENAVMIATSNEIGEFFFENVPYGTWIVKELKATEGYVLNSQFYFATVSENEALVEVVIENDFITGSVWVSKVDSKDSDKLLSGAVFEIYVDADGDEVFNADVDILVGTLEESMKGLYTMDELRYGGYFVYEKTAPEGYTKSDEYVYFEIVEDGSIIEITATNDEIIVPQIPDTDANEEEDNGYFFLIIWLGGSVFILVVGYFYVLKPKLAKKKANKNKKVNTNSKK